MRAMPNRHIRIRTSAPSHRMRGVLCTELPCLLEVYTHTEIHTINQVHPQPHNSRVFLSTFRYGLNLAKPIRIEFTL
jgi:hypothetical protein